ncbi:MAG: hypothetical protein A3G27_11595 [Betaproteobacteria bacterium RIFCSPLOWO2_12_FULL_66_14]|nr:MAG: hypothetical protein A3G27_11595 [Betaproteobacteria bacterium RIFCSPLOWO2_12_FULL_66_14]
MSSERILVFAKAPEPGRVKTRLIPALGPQGAALLYRAMMRHCLGTAFSALPGGVELWCAPDISHPFFAECGARWDLPLREQPSGDIGERMSEAMRRALGEAGSALIFGSDVPTITGTDVRGALAALASGCDAVFVPTEDGGYGLIGLARHDPVLFEGIAWSTPSVMEQTRERLSELGWRWRELPARWDVDRPQDVERLAGDVRLSHLLADATSSPASRRS